MRGLGPDAGLQARLRAWASRESRGITAAVELLISHRAWLQRPDFRDVAVTDRPEQGWASVDFPAALGAVRSNELYAASSAATVLLLAGLLADDGLRLGTLDQENAEIVLGAMATAMGVHRAPLSPRSSSSWPPSQGAERAAGGPVTVAAPSWGFRW